VRLIATTVWPETWGMVGGPGSIRVHDGALVIMHRRDVHRDVSALLELLREGRRQTEEHPGKAPQKVAIRRNAPAEAAIRAALDKRISFAFQEAPLRAATAEIGAKLGVQVFVDRKALDNVGLSEEAPVTLAVENMKAEAALTFLLEQLDLTWRIADEVFLITLPEQEERKLETRVYPVADLSGPMRRRLGFTEEWDDVGVGALIRTITSSIAPEVWKDVGGFASIEPLPSAGVLAIAVTPKLHEQVETLLTRLRQQIPPQAATADKNGELKLFIYSLPTPPDPAATGSNNQRSGDLRQQRSVAPDAEKRTPVQNATFAVWGGAPPFDPTPIPSDDLETIIRTLVAPDSWATEGAYLKAVPGRLIVRQTEPAHRAIASLLLKLGLVPPRPVSLQSRYGAY
jgi:hypothetical protein